MQYQYKMLLELSMSFLAGLATTLGALVVLCFDKSGPSPAQMSFALALAAGVMITVSVVEMWVPPLLEGTHLGRTAFWSLAGCSAFWVVSKLVGSDPVPGGSLLPTASSAASTAERVEQDRARNARLGLLMMVTLTAHNFPEGLAVAVSALSSQRLGAVVMLAIAIHNIPEGIAIAVPVYAASGSARRAFLMAFLSGLSEPLGAFVALVFLGDSVSKGAVEGLLCFVAGVMTAVAVLELLPEAFRYGRPKAMVAGFAAGVAIMLGSIAVMP